MGFSPKWRKWISSCLSSSTISVIVNGSTTNAFTATKGLRQGDPLSPFLFLIAAEGFNVLMTSAIEANVFSGIQIGTGGFKLSHLQYADDTVILGESDWKNIRAAKFILKWYEIVSGLSINFKKSKLIAINRPSSWLYTAAEFLNCKTENLPSTYLGMPIGSSPRSHRFWVPVIQRVEKRLCAWKSRVLSAGARVTLVKSVLTSLPLYFCSLFKMPTVVINKLNTIIRTFFWGEGENGKKTKWISWGKVCLDRKSGGLGIPDIRKKNISLLGKWWYRFGLESESLWKCVIVEKYYRNSSALSPILLQTDHLSNCWKDIVCIGDYQVHLPRVSTISSCFKWKLGAGEKIRFWHDNWADHLPLKTLFPRLFALAVDKNAPVLNMGFFCDQNSSSWTWRIDTISAPRGRTLSEYQELSILLASKRPSPASDSFIWDTDQGSKFSVAALYDILSPSSAILPKEVINIIWLKWSPPRVRIFTWKVAHDVLPISWNLLRRGIIPRLFDPLCCLCKGELESQNHLFLSCPHVLPLWTKINMWWSTYFILPNSTFCLLQQCQAVTEHSGINQLFQTVCVCTLWAIWYGRNNWIFNNVHWDVDGLFHFIQSRTYAWLRGLAPDKTFSPSDWFSFPHEVARLF